MKSIRRRSLRKSRKSERKSRKLRKSNKRVRRIYGGTESGETKSITLTYSPFNIQRKNDLITKLVTIKDTDNGKQNIKTITLNKKKYSINEDGEQIIDESGENMYVIESKNYSTIDELLTEIRKPGIDWGTTIVIDYN